MIPAESFWTHSLRKQPEGSAITRILAAAIQAVEPGEAVRRHVHQNKDTLTIAGLPYDLTAYRRVYLLGIGKASVAMAEALAELVGHHLAGSLVVSKHPPAVSKFPFPIIQGGHPVPDERSLLAGTKVVEFVSSLSPDDLLFCLISGGSSSLVTAPVDGVKLADMQSLTSRLLSCGARIDEINLLRRYLDRVKGGGLALLANHATIVSLILSDVVGNPLEAIASGPTAPDPMRKADALAVIERYSLHEVIPESIRVVLERSSETPKPDNLIFKNVKNVLVGSNLLAAQAALRQAAEEGFHPYLLRTDLQGEARETAFDLATFLRQTSRTGNPVPCPACIVAGGETTVKVKGKGRGGRNTELALAAVSELADFPKVMLVSLATDGEDGSTDAAGAVVTGDTFQRAACLGLHGEEYLEMNDSYSFFAALDDLLKPGLTGTNVNDLIFLFTF
jgi:hydroxypyruvate reductase